MCKLNIQIENEFSQKLNYKRDVREGKQNKLWKGKESLKA